MKSDMIPKIIHQIGPQDKTKWHPVWNICHKTWIDTFADYQFILWNDSEDIDNFIKEKYPERFDFYNQLPFHMMKMDFFRYAVLNYYGGVYADLDIYCYQDFFNDLSGEVCLIEPIKFDEHKEDLIMGCLMASSGPHTFWEDCMNVCQELYDQETKQKLENTFVVFDVFYDILKITGPNLLNRVFSQFEDKSTIQLLSANHYHPDVSDYFPNMKTKHMKTMTWGKDSIELFERGINNQGLDYETGMKRMFSDIRGVDIDLFDFQKQYN